MAEQDYIHTDKFGNSRGETLLPGVDGAVESHEARYRWAITFFTQGSKVLDVGCGIGYGSKILLEKCGKYVGFDKYPCRKQRADESYADKRATFLTHSANYIFPFKDNMFDAVVCFEAIEHFENDYHAVSEINRVLKPGGTFVCSTPINRGKQKGRYHIKEYTVDAFIELIGSKFTDVKYYSQQRKDHTFLKDVFKGTYVCCVAKKSGGSK